MANGTRAKWMESGGQAKFGNTPSPRAPPPCARHVDGLPPVPVPVPTPAALPPAPQLAPQPTALAPRHRPSIRLQLGRQLAIARPHPTRRGLHGQWRHASDAAVLRPNAAPAHERGPFGLAEAARFFRRPAAMRTRCSIPLFTSTPCPPASRHLRNLVCDELRAVLPDLGPKLPASPI